MRWHVPRGTDWLLAAVAVGLVAAVLAAPAWIQRLLVADEIELIWMPAEALPCGAPGVEIHRTSGTVFHVARGIYSPAALAIQAWPVLPGRIFCDSFEASGG
jgi:hypothetical protein